jgi:hypothetical protein
VPPRSLRSSASFKNTRQTRRLTRSCSTSLNPISTTMPTKQDQINADVQQRLMDLVKSHKDQRKRLTALEEESGERRRSATAAVLDRSTPSYPSRYETKRIIPSTSQENLANILVKLCDRDDNTQKSIAGELLKCKTTPVTASASASTPSATRASVAAPVAKRNLPRISKTVEEICRVCGETYDASEADLTECIYHPGLSSPCTLHLHLV